jgi:hypothetical protein
MGLVDDEMSVAGRKGKLKFLSGLAAIFLDCEILVIVGGWRRYCIDQI